jgi:hypothetical protein
MSSTKPGSFYNSRDTWSSTVAEAEAHARYHAELQDRHEDYSPEEDPTCDVCEGDDFVSPENMPHSWSATTDVEVDFVCFDCGAEYDECGILIEEVEDA